MPQFETLTDRYVLNALWDRLKPVLLMKNTCILCEREPIEEMIFIKRGNLKAVGQNGSTNLNDGDFFGEELVTWALGPSSSSHNLPISTKTMTTTSYVEAYALTANDLMFIAPQLQLHIRCAYNEIF